jgi:tRNA (guanine37-N1)-methyltransferase
MKIPKKQGEKGISLANKLGILDKSLAIQRDDHQLLIPLARRLLENEILELREQIPEIEFTTSFFAKKRQSTETFMQALQEKLDVNLLSSVPQAFDTIGDIVVIDIPLELKPHQALIGDAILKTHKNIRTVLAKAGDIHGVYRVRNYTLVAGENKTRTVHKEFGCEYHVDIGKAYFSPRLSHEHERVASLVKSNEVVGDLFAGAGPFSVLIAKKNPNTRVYAIDLNPDAIELLKLNVKANRVEKQVLPILGDAREIVKTTLKGTCDRVIMNLPETAIDFVDVACDAIKQEGGVVHFYGFIRSPESIDNLKQRFTELVKKNHRKIEKVLNAKSIRETAPFESQVVLDVRISKIQQSETS